MQTKFEDWELTAFALGELSPERSKQIEQMIQDDPAMARELASLGDWIGRVSEALHSDVKASTIPSSVASIPAHAPTSKSRLWLTGLSYLATAASFLILGYFGQRALDPERSPENPVALKTPETPAEVALSPVLEELVELKQEHVVEQEAIASQHLSGDAIILPELSKSVKDTTWEMKPSSSAKPAKAYRESTPHPYGLLADLDAKVLDYEYQTNSGVDESKNVVRWTIEKRENAEIRWGDHRVSGDRFDAIIENAFLRVKDAPFSTFSIDVDTASYTKARQYLLEAHQLPQPSAIRMEEWINYFPYRYEGPTGDVPFASALAVAECPWNVDHRLVRIALQAKKIDTKKRPVSNLVFLLDVSGSMNEPNKLPLVKESMRLLINQLTENDRVSIVVYAGAAGTVLPSTTGDQKATILEALERLAAGGSTNGAQGIQLAYQIARENFIPGATNRIILCTDGDFNVGVTSNADLIDLVAENAKSKVFLTVLGFGMGNTNDSMMEQITNRGNGLYGFVDSELEARRMMVEQLSGSLITVAKDVKIQVEFNPQQISGYRLIGYENRMLATQDFANDKKDAGEIGAGHCVTALYEIVPLGKSIDSIPAVDKPRYQTPSEPTAAANSNELLIVKVRYKQPEADQSSLLEFPLQKSEGKIQAADTDFQWAAAIAQFCMLLRNSEHKGNTTWEGLLEVATSLAQESNDPYRLQAVELMRAAKQLQPK